MRTHLENNHSGQLNTSNSSPQPQPQAPVTTDIRPQQSGTFYYPNIWMVGPQLSYENSTESWPTASSRGYPQPTLQQGNGFPLSLEDPRSGDARHAQRTVGWYRSPLERQGPFQEYERDTKLLANQVASLAIESDPESSNGANPNSTAESFDLSRLAYRSAAQTLSSEPDVTSELQQRSSFSNSPELIPTRGAVIDLEGLPPASTPLRRSSVKIKDMPADSDTTLSDDQVLPKKRIRKGKLQRAAKARAHERNKKGRRALDASRSDLSDAVVPTAGNFPALAEHSSAVAQPIVPAAEDFPALSLCRSTIAHALAGSVDGDSSASSTSSNAVSLAASQSSADSTPLHTPKRGSVELPGVGGHGYAKRLACHTHGGRPKDVSEPAEARKPIRVSTLSPLNEIAAQSATNAERSGRKRLSWTATTFSPARSVAAAGNQLASEYRTNVAKLFTATPPENRQCWPPLSHNTSMRPERIAAWQAPASYARPHSMSSASSWLPPRPQPRHMYVLPPFSGHPTMSRVQWPATSGAGWHGQGSVGRPAVQVVQLPQGPSPSPPAVLTALLPRPAADPEFPPGLTIVRRAPIYFGTITGGQQQ